MSKFLSCLYFTFLIFLNNCTKPSNIKNNITPSFDSLYNNAFKNVCDQCHAPGKSPYTIGVPLDFTSKESAYSTLISSSLVTPSLPGICNGVSIIVSNNPNNSYLAGVLIASYNVDNFAGVSGCTPDKNHINANYLSSDEAQSALVQWIQEGALNN